MVRYPAGDGFDQAMAEDLAARIRYHSADDMHAHIDPPSHRYPAAVVLRTDGSVDVYGDVGVVDQRPTPPRARPGIAGSLGHTLDEVAAADAEHRRRQKIIRQDDLDHVEIDIAVLGDALGHLGDVVQEVARRAAPGDDDLRDVAREWANSYTLPGGRS
jgi:hypothetical protein